MKIGEMKRLSLCYLCMGLHTSTIDGIELDSIIVLSYCL